MAEAVHGVGELGADRRVDLGVVAGAGFTEQADHRLHLADELLERQVLVLHLGDEAGGLEQAILVAPTGTLGRDLGPPGELFSGEQRRVVEHSVDLVTEPVVLRVEDVVHGGQADVLVDPPVAGDEVRIEQFVVVRARRSGSGAS